MLQPLNKIAEEAIARFRVCEGTIRVDPRACAIDPSNRQSTLMSGKRVHALINSIVRAGFSEAKAGHSVVVDVDTKRLPEILEHNKKLRKVTHFCRSWALHLLFSLLCTRTT
jgi:hypothetical protein